MVYERVRYQKPIRHKKRKIEKNQKIESIKKSFVSSTQKTDYG